MRVLAGKLLGGLRRRGEADVPLPRAAGYARGGPQLRLLQQWSRVCVLGELAGLHGVSHPVALNERTRGKGPSHAAATAAAAAAAAAAVVTYRIWLTTRVGTQ